jgi:hypothetical protein
MMICASKPPSVSILEPTVIGVLAPGTTLADEADGVANVADGVATPDTLGDVPAPVAAPPGVDEPVAEAVVVGVEVTVAVEVVGVAVAVLAAVPVVVGVPLEVLVQAGNISDNVSRIIPSKETSFLIIPSPLVDLMRFDFSRYDPTTYIIV